MVKENNEMDAKTKLAIITGNVQAMEALIKDIKSRISSAKDGINWIFIHLLEKRPNRFSYSNVSCYNDKIYVVYETETCIKLKDISIQKRN